MKVKCKNIFNEIENKFVDTNPWITIGKEYVVLEILCSSKNGVSYRLISDDSYESPGIFKAHQFDVISPKKASNWDFYIMDNGYLTIGPSAWFEPGFWEKCYDGDPEALKVYKREVTIILEESKA